MAGMNPVSWLARFYPSFISVILLACFAIGSSVSSMDDSFPDTRAIEEGHIAIMLATAMVLCLIVVVSHVLLVKGRSWAVWPVVVVFLICLVMSLRSYSPDLPTWVNVSTIMFPLLGLLLLNSRRHREMRQHLLFLRHQRESLR